MIKIERLRVLQKKYSSLGVEFMWVIFAQLFSLIGGLITIKLLSNILSKSEFAIYALLFSLVSLLGSVLFTPLGQVNMRFIILAQQGGFVKRLKKEQTHLLILISLVSLIFLIPCIYLFTEYVDSWGKMYLGLALLSLTMGFQAMWQFQLMAFRLRRETSIAQIIGAIARPLAVYLFLFIFGTDSISAIYGLAFGFAALAFAQCYFLRPAWKSAIELNRNQREAKSEKTVTGFKEYLSYGSVYSLIGLVTIIVLSADRWILSFSESLEKVAIYAALMQVALAPTAFSFAIVNRLVSPIYYKTKDKPHHEQIKQFRSLLSFWMGISGTVLLVTWLFHSQIVTILTNEEYAQFSYLLPWMVLGLLFERSAQVLEMKGSMLLNTKIYIIPRLLTILFVPVVEYVFLHFLGFDWLVIGLVVGTTFSLFSIVFVNKIQL